MAAPRRLSRPPPPLLRLWYLADYHGRAGESPIGRAMVEFKYRDGRHLGRRLAALVRSKVRSLAPEFDLVVPVPLGRRRLRERGYDQAAWLARGAAHGLGLPCRPDTLRRQRETQPQTGLGAQARRLNLRSAFGVTGPDLGGQRLLLVDDVLTTGATVTAAARALAEAGTGAISALVLLRVRRSGLH